MKTLDNCVRRNTLSKIKNEMKFETYKCDSNSYICPKNAKIAYSLFSKDIEFEKWLDNDIILILSNYFNEIIQWRI